MASSQTRASDRLRVVVPAPVVTGWVPQQLRDGAAARDVMGRAWPEHRAEADELDTGREPARPHLDGDLDADRGTAPTGAVAAAGGRRRRGLLAAALHDRVPPWLRSSRSDLTPAALALLAAVVVAALAVVAVLVLRRSPAPADASSDTADAPLPVTAAPATPTGLVVDVGGRVHHPGLVTLPSGSRVADAVRAAGGALTARDVASLNLAARVADGQLLLVGVPGAQTDAGAAGTGAGGSGSSGPVDLNAATVEQLDALPGVGPVMAQRIVSWREAHGGFRSVADLRSVPGIGDRKFADLKPLVTT